MKTGQPSRDPMKMFLGLRHQVLTLDADSAGLNPIGNDPGAWGVLSEFGTPGGTATVVSLADGTTSMYTSTGGGVIGAGVHPGPAQVSKALVETALSFISHMHKTDRFPLPERDNVRLSVLTTEGICTTEYPEALKPRDTHHPFFGLYAGAQEVLTQIRGLVDQPGKRSR